MAYKGKFQPRNPQKYLGDPSNIVYRSRWELKFMGWLDNHPGVLQWGSEELIIPYRSPIDGRVHRYFPDFIINLIRDILLKYRPGELILQSGKLLSVTAKNVAGSLRS
jgi:hypothetical protein